MAVWVFLIRFIQDEHDALVLRECVIDQTSSISPALFYAAGPFSARSGWRPDAAAPRRARRPELVPFIRQNLRIL